MDMAGLRKSGVLPGLFKRRYLVQLIGTAVICTFVPIGVYFGIVFSRSYNELITARENYFREITRLFSVSFHRQVARSYSAAIQISVDSRNSRSPSFVLQSSRFQINSYYYLECIRAISLYARESEPEAGVYFPSADCLFTKNHKYTADSYISGGLNVREPAAAEKIREFFGCTGGSGYGNGGAGGLEGRGINNNLIFCSTFPDMYDRGMLLAGVPVKLGPDREDALIFFRMDSSAFDLSSFYTEGEDLQFCVFGDSGTELLYSTGFFFSRKIIASLDRSKLHQVVSAEDMRYRIFTVEEETFGNRYVSIIPLDRITGSIYAFIQAMRKIGAAACIVIIIFLCFMVYINYKPINDFTNEMSERNQLILDLLLGSLLYGLPIPRKEAEKLGLTKHTGNFCVITVFEMQFRTADRKSLTAGLYERFSITSYMTDILYRNYTVIICLLPSGEIGPLEEYLKTFIRTPVCFEIGKVVSSLSEIKYSYQTCLDRQRNGDAQESLLLKREIIKRRKTAVQQDVPPPGAEKASGAEHTGTDRFRDTVLRYVREQFSNPQVSQISVADHFGISIYSLSRLFNNDIGIGFSEFIIAQRMDRAKELLLSTDKDIADIAAAVGLTNANYFSRLFKSCFGMIPSRYRAEQTRTGQR
jgi:AraC-like DNA-binding protein